MRTGRSAPWGSLPPGERSVDLAWVRTAFASAGPGAPSPVERSTSRSAAVLAPLYEEDGSASVVLTRRSQHLRAHRGEVSFPGGGREGDESLVATALREAKEEIDLDPSTVEIVGELDHLSTVTSSSYVVPYVGVLPARPTGLRPQEAEVERILHVPLAELLIDGVYHEELWPFGEGVERSLSFFDLADDTIWGATAGMLRQLLSVVLGVAGS